MNKMARLIFVVFSFLAFLAQVNAQTLAKEDSVTTPISLKYIHKSFLTKLLLGKNYRKVWATPVTMPVFHLATTNGGFTIEKMGGGMQTKSLRLKDQKGREWVLRSVDKDVKDEAVPSKLRIPFILNMVQDMISAAHPYAPLAVSTLADAAGIVAAKPRLFFVPDDPALGNYQSLFAGTVCMLELREPTPDHSDTKSTETVLEKVYEEHDHLVIQQEVLKARLLDMYIADWDRHADQWRWGKIETGGIDFYYAIPRDRDQAFFNSNGLLIKLVALIGMPHFVGFKKYNMHLKKLNYKSWQFDRFFLNELTAEDWQRTVKGFQQKITDSVINTAVHQFPASVYNLDGEEIKEKLTARRNRLYKQVMDYYRFISSNITIAGSDENEVFKITGDGTNLFVTVSATINGTIATIYSRKILPSETKKITLMGLGGHDTFIIDKTAQSAITLDIQGGPGADTYDIQGGVKNTITDKAADDDQIVHSSKSRIKMSRK